MIGKLKQALVNRYHKTHATKNALNRLRNELSTHRAARDAAALNHYDALKAKAAFDKTKAVERASANMMKGPDPKHLEAYMDAANIEGKLSRATNETHGVWGKHAKEHTRVKDTFKAIREESEKAAQAYASTRLKYGATIVGTPLAILGVAGVNHHIKKKRAQLRQHTTDY